jgi:hypothetical protein
MLTLDKIELQITLDRLLSDPDLHWVVDTENEFRGLAGLGSLLVLRLYLLSLWHDPMVISSDELEDDVLAVVVGLLKVVKQLELSLRRTELASFGVMLNSAERDQLDEIKDRPSSEWITYSRRDNPLEDLLSVLGVPRSKTSSSTSDDDDSHGKPSTSL